MNAALRRARGLTAVGAVALVGALVLCGCSSSGVSGSPSSGSTGSSPSNASGSSSSASAESSASGSSGSSSGSSGSSSSGANQGSSTFSFIGLTSNKTPANTLKALSTGACSSTVANATLTTDSVDQTSQDQKLQLLAGQGALPSAMIAPNAPQLVQQLITNGNLLNVSTVLDKDGLSKEILPAAASTIQKLYGQHDLYALPNEFNIEGIWYNKKIFADNDITVPTTWDALVADMAKLQAAGVQPITADGKDGWPVTRWVGDYIFRSLGPDAMQSVADGKAKLTDPGYVKAADAVAELGTKGYFGKNVASNDYNGSVNDFLTGKAAMMYMGSWVLSNFNDKTQNKIGANNIGFMRFPAVANGKGDIDQIPSNVGQPIVFSKKRAGAGTDAWIDCIAKNYGDTVLDKSGVVSGFTLHKSHDVPTLTKLVQQQMSSASSSVLWFEALFSAKATTVSQSNGGLLGSGGISGADFMSKVQAAVGE